MKGLLKLLPSAMAIVMALSAPVSASKAEQCEIDTRQTKMVSEQVGRRIQRAFEVYGEDDAAGAIEILSSIRTRNNFDRAFVDRFLGNIYASSAGELDSAKKHLDDAVKANVLSGTDHAQALKLLADLQVQSRQFEAALANYEAWLAFSCKEDAATYLRMASANFELKRHDQVTPLANKSIALFEQPNRGPYALKMGSYYETKQYKKAAEVIEEMVNLFPDDKRLWVQLGQIYMLNEQFHKALYTLDVSFRAGYLSSAAEHKMLAQLYAQNGQPFQSARLQEYYLKEGLVDRDESALSLLANTYHMAKELDQAIKVYDEVAQLTNESRYYLRQANLQMQREQFYGAKKALRAAIKSTDIEDPAAAQLLLAQVHFYLGEYSAAYQQAQLAAKDENQANAANSWSDYIKATADRKKVEI